MSTVLVGTSRVERSRGWIDRALSLSPLQPLARWGSARRLAVLAYHAILDADQFRRQVRYLKARMRPVSLDDVIEARSERGSLPDHAVLVTFDDGDRSVLEVGAPILKELGVPGVVCVVAGLLDSHQPLWWEEALDLWKMGGRSTVASVSDEGSLIRALKRLPDDQRRIGLDELRRTADSAPRSRPQLRGDELGQLEAAGIEVANHTLTHPILPNCTSATLEEEIRTAHDILRTDLGQPPRSFAYPNGDWDGRAAALLREIGYEIAFLFDHRLSRLRLSDMMSVSRLRVNSDTSSDRFRIILSGLHPAIHHALGRP